MNNFLFSINNKTVHRHYRESGNSIYCNNTFGPIFGGGHDICISSPFDSLGWCNLGHTYEPPEGY